MPRHLGSAPLRLAFSFGALNPAVAKLLAMQHDEEPETRVKLIETSSAEQMQGIENGDYDIGLSLAKAKRPSISSFPLWEDEIAVAVPVNSPLLTLDTIPLRELENYPLIMWAADGCAPMSEQIASMLQSERIAIDVAHEVKTFGVLANLVAAGYGIALGARSQFAASRHLEIIMRPLSGPPRPLTTYLLHSKVTSNPCAERFIERARRIAAARALAH
ncbi:hypothetical protein ACO34A_23655 (plasmid) [Rhizobium sp. ACO-34A]|nr:LysR family substrate-binding domain-containing protein [Rhizobium sp. ACO-34A]ATN36781.1 hypothetical protein ACO34A_23655 [Rhizobium sp. ACO-34A]